MSNKFKIIGERVPIRDAVLKATGQLKYTADMKIPNMLYAKVLFSPIAHAKIKKIDTSKAEKLEGVKAIATYKNSPQKAFNSAMRFYEHELPEVEYIFDDTVRFVGDKVAAVAAEDLQTAEKALKLIEVEYEELPSVFNPEEAIQEGAYPIHKGGNKLAVSVQQCGNIEEAMKKADYIFEDKYTLPAIHHGAIETHVAIADYDYSGKLTVYSPNQNTFGFRIILSKLFEVPMNKVRLVSPAIGGAFGGKLEITIEPIVALLAKLSGRPVKLELNRRETIASTRTRHGAVVYLKTGVMKDGRIVAQDMKVLTNTGAYASSALNVIGAMSHKVFKAYKIENMRYTGIPVYTNTPIAGAMRGYGSPQAFFAQQSQLNKIAKKLNMDILDLQLKNLVEPDGIDQRFKSPHGNPRPIDCIKKGAEMFDWKKQIRQQNESNGRFLIGVGMAVGSHGNGCFGAHRDITALMLKMNEDGSAVLYTGTHDMGNASVSVQVQIISEVLGISQEKIECIQADTEASPWNLGDYASRGVFVSGNATLKVANSVKKELLKEASQLLKEDEEYIEFKDDRVYSIKNNNKQATLCDVMIHAQRVSLREIIGAETFASQTGASSYGVHFAKVEVDTKLASVRVLEYVAVHDVGKALNPMSVEGQIEGAIQMGIGYALTEALEFDNRGRIKANSFRSYHMIKASEMPQIKVGMIECGEPGGPFGAKSIGECSVVPSAPAVANAVANALNCDFYSLPLKKNILMDNINI
ncbi:molybdopterin cofactor-binding domain-containing protein [Clostridioides sp. ES-S-0145-01]|uniref:xanthine dehydrogenase family protein molybdopterin-binding subunit n=1 Tax=Clostridioides sp. ES-S-0145-01 TaxID=2770784 RepID=UPI001D10973A